MKLEAHYKRVNQDKQNFETCEPFMFIIESLKSIIYG